MFTGLIEAVGKVAGVTHAKAGSAGRLVRLRIKAPFSSELQIGESVAVEGVCLTMVARGKGWFEVDVVPETLDRTMLGDLEVGGLVNLERALKIGDRLGGHFVQGHVNGVGRVEDGGRGLRISFPHPLRRYIAEKGSITISGVSLTVAMVGSDFFEVALIPHTLKSTTLGHAKVGDRVNLEVDLLARYLDVLKLHP